MSTSSVYDRRQQGGNWPPRGRWNPDDLPGWYLELLGELCGSLTRWRNPEAGREFPASCDPRRTPDERGRRSCHACE
jgi:hypothetical protein